MARFSVALRFFFFFAHAIATPRVCSFIQTVYNMPVDAAQGAREAANSAIRRFARSAAAAYHVFAAAGHAIYASRDNDARRRRPPVSALRMMSRDAPRASRDAQHKHAFAHAGAAARHQDVTSGSRVVLRHLRYASNAILV